tara:strand:+ start:787 stop:1629 length:843 start_codon:yes stop_codon:yes gene_type:complete
MIQNSFIQLPGIGAKKEISLWNDGVFSWSDFINKRKELGFRLDEDKSLSHIQTCLNNLANNQVDYFYNTLPSSEEWRLFREFQNHCLYLDIETNGGNFFSGFITTIATYDGNEIRYYVHGKNLDDFITDVFNYKILITYNGKSFDIPFIQNFFNVELNHAQIDLRYILASLGFKGGLKSCEQQLGLLRDGLDGVDGYFAIHLWNDYYYNANQKALETLLAYNIEDSINLEKLMQISFNMKIDSLGFENFKKVPNYRTPKNIFQPHFETISKIKSTISYNY